MNKLYWFSSVANDVFLFFYLCYFPDYHIGFLEGCILVSKVINGVDFTDWNFSWTFVLTTVVVTVVVTVLATFFPFAQSQSDLQQ